MILHIHRNVPWMSRKPREGAHLAQGEVQPAVELCKNLTFEGGSGDGQVKSQAGEGRWGFPSTVSIGLHRKRDTHSTQL